ncbi:MAG: EVE domain-containing protein [Alphaproteobacteria bacterium]|nr:EVE domain-containing protein [Alphaproteobacteria bacterium]
MNYWLFKSEPYKYSWDNLCKDKQTYWDGVRNYQARNYMRQMEIGDFGLFYHSNEGKEAVGIVKIIKKCYPDHTFKPEPNKSNPWEMVDIAAVAPLKKAVTLAAVKSNPELSNMALVTKQRLSVQPITPEEWQKVLDMAETKQPERGAAL